MLKSIAVYLSIIGAVLVGLAGCASIVNGTGQSVAVHTGSLNGAQCMLENDKGNWVIPSTPGSVTVNRSYKDLVIKCHKPGYRVSYKRVPSKTKAMAFGNLVFGGPVGAGVDMIDGAAYDYPNEIFMPLQKAKA